MTYVKSSFVDVFLLRRKAVESAVVIHPHLTRGVTVTNRTCQIASRINLATNQLRIGSFQPGNKSVADRAFAGLTALPCEAACELH